MNINDQDQAFAALRDMAALTFKYYTQLLKEGFNPSQAIQLTVNWQTEMLKSSLNK